MNTSQCETNHVPAKYVLFGASQMTTRAIVPVVILLASSGQSQNRQVNKQKTIK